MNLGAANEWNRYFNERNMKNILAFNGFLRKICAGIVEGGEVDGALLRECIDFGRIMQTSIIGKERKNPVPHHDGDYGSCCR